LKLGPNNFCSPPSLASASKSGSFEDCKSPLNMSLYFDIYFMSKISNFTKKVEKG